MDVSVNIATSLCGVLGGVALDERLAKEVRCYKNIIAVNCHICVDCHIYDMAALLALVHVFWRLKNWNVEGFSCLCGPPK